GERVTCTHRLAQAQRRPAAAVQCPDPQVLPGRLLRDLPEQPVGLLDAVEAPQRLGLPVPRLPHQLALGALAHGVVEGLGRILEVAALEARATALERLRATSPRTAARAATR